MKLLIIPDISEKIDLSYKALNQELEYIAQVEKNIVVKKVNSRRIAFGNYLGCYKNGDAAVFSNKELIATEEIESILGAIDAIKAVNHVIDYSEAEESDIFLHGNASVVVDEINERAYCSISENADEELFIEFCEEFEYNPVFLSSSRFDHTNEFLFVSEKYALVCLDAIRDKKEKKQLVTTLKKDGVELINISIDQAEHFVTQGVEMEGKLLLSQTAIESLDEDIKSKIQKYVPIVGVDFNLHEKKYGKGLSNYFINIP